MSPKHEHACDSLDKDMLILSPMRALWGQSTTSEPGYAQASLQAAPFFHHPEGRDLVCPFSIGGFPTNEVIPRLYEVPGS